MRMFGKDFAYLKGHRLICIEAWLDEDQVRALPLGHDRWHRRANTKFSCLVARGGHDTTFARTAHSDGLASQLRIIPLFDGSVKGVHIDVDDLALLRGHSC